MNRIGSGSIILFFATAILAHSAAAPAVEWQDTVADSHLAVAEQAAIVEIIEDAHAMGYPSQALINRVQEGIAKQRSYAELEQAIDSDIEYLDRSVSVAALVEGGEALLGDPLVWERAATLLRSGLEPESLSGLIRSCVARPSTFVEASVLYVQLKEWGLDSTASLRLTDAAVASRIDPQEYREITALFAEAVSATRSADTALNVVIDGLSSGLSIRQLQRQLRR